MGKVHGKTKIDRFPLYPTEKLNLIKYFDDIRLIKKSEFINNCRHQNNILLKSLKRNNSID